MSITHIYVMTLLKPGMYGIMCLPLFLISHDAEYEQIRQPPVRFESATFPCEERQRKRLG